jgi:SAM-dependent methyltransferase
MLESDEPAAVIERYARRDSVGSAYQMLAPDVYMRVQERQRALIRMLRGHAPRPIDDMDVLEVGCGTGTNLLELICLGFRPDRVAGNELIEQRARIARERLPAATVITQGDAMTSLSPEPRFDIVYQSTVFSSILDQDFRFALARLMWSMTRAGGAILWYDFAFDNPRNPDVRGVSIREVRSYFPDGIFTVSSVTLAPPLSRLVTRIHPSIYTTVNVIPWLRTHRLCWIKKP